MDAPAAVVDHRARAGGEAHGRGTDVTVPDQQLLFRPASAEASVGADADPESLPRIPRQGQDTAVMILTRRPPPALRRPKIPDPYLAVRATNGELACRAERDGGNLLAVWPFGEEDRRVRGAHIPYP
jgi:hypothetical protein